MPQPPETWTGQPAAGEGAAAVVSGAVPSSTAFAGQAADLAAAPVAAIPFTPSSYGLRRGSAARALWRVWQLLFGACLLVVEAAVVAVCAAQPRPGVICYGAIIGLFLVGVPGLCLLNPADILGRLLWFSEARFPRVCRAAVLAATSLAVFMALGLAFGMAGLEVGEISV